MAISPGSQFQGTDLDCFTSQCLFPSTAMSYNPLTLPSTGHTGDLGDAQLQSGGPRRLTCLNLHRDLVLGRLPCLNLHRDPTVQGSQEVDMPQPAQGPNSQEANMP